MAILNHLRRVPLSRADLARATGLAKSAMSRLVEELLQEGLLEEGPAAPSQGVKGVYWEARREGRNGWESR